MFTDLNLPHADDLLAKAELTAKIIAEIQRRRLAQSQAAVILGIDQPKVSVLKSRGGCPASRSSGQCGSSWCLGATSKSRLREGPSRGQ